MAKWTNEEIDFIKNNYQTMTDLELSKYLPNHPSKSIKYKRQDLGLTKDKAHRKYSFQDVINEFEKTDYILLSDENDYYDAATNSLRYLCPNHLDKGEMTISLGHLQTGRGCWYCGRERTENGHLLSDSILDTVCNKTCNKKGLIYKGWHRDEGLIYIDYICPKHKTVGIQSMRKGNMERDFIIGCPYCVEIKNIRFSKGVKEIEKYLKEKCIQYIQEFTFNDCRDINLLPFDFYLPKYNKCIEYDGEHHFRPVTFNGISKEEAQKNHEMTVKHDFIKNQYCENNNISLLRIPYYEFKDIKNILDIFLLNERKIA